MNDATLTIGQVARQVGLKTSAIRCELAARKLPEVKALIERATAMRQWLTTATGCRCETLDVCGLFDVGVDEHAAGSVLTVTHVGGGRHDGSSVPS